MLPTNAPYDVAAIGQLYRDRCDCENGDELKNLDHEGDPLRPSRWGSFTTQQRHRSQVTARAGAQACNGCNWDMRAANPQARREAPRGRLLPLSASASLLPLGSDGGARSPRLEQNPVPPQRARSAISVGVS